MKREERSCLLEAKRAGPAPPRQGWRVPRPRFAACGLDRLSPARQGLAMQLRLNGKRSASLPELEIVASWSILPGPFSYRRW